MNTAVSAQPEKAKLFLIEQDHKTDISICKSCSFKKNAIELNGKINFYKTLIKRLQKKEAALKKEQSDLRARIKYLEGQLYGKKTEKRCRTDQSFHFTKTRNNRGHRVGVAGPKRRLHTNLPIIEDIEELQSSAIKCPHCNRPYREINSTENSEEIIVDVKAYRRVIKRKKYKPLCQCQQYSKIITAPTPPKLIPKGKLGISTWVMILLEKYLHQCPLNRLLNSLSLYGISIPSATIINGIKKLIPLFDPINEAIKAKNRSGNFWQADETRWFVFEAQDGKRSFEWYMWVFISAEAVVYLLDADRSSKVIKSHLGSIDRGILCTDRFSGYKCFVDSKEQVLWSLCWAHVRRDFLEVGKRNRKLEKWTISWIKHIGSLYHYNKKRLKYSKTSKRFALADRKLKEKLLEMEKQCDKELCQASLDESAKKVLKSLKKYWQELTVFVEHPHIPMDNNASERKMRIPVVGRKNYYGSGAIWNGHFLASMLSLFQTLFLWDINPRNWLYEYLNACAKNGGKAPLDFQSYLPWNMPQQIRTRLSIHFPYNDTS